MESTHSTATDPITDSGIAIREMYGPENMPSSAEHLAPAGEFPFTRGPYAGMYRVRPWTMRQYAGFATASETNERFHYLLDRGQTGLSVAFDLPTQLGLDSDDPRSLGEVGRTGVAIDSLDDMRRLFTGIPLDTVSTSMTINAPASLLILMYQIIAAEQGGDPHSIRGTIQNDILKEYVARGNYIFPPTPSMRLTTDLFAWCAEYAPRFNTISISGYHIREAGSSAAEELALTFSHGIAYVQAALDAGLDIESFAPRLSFFFNSHNNFFQEVAKFRAARQLWAHIMRDRFGATSVKAQSLRFHAQTGGSTLTAQQPHNNIARVAIQAFSAACGGAQSIHTNGFDEALALPSQHAAEVALRTQQILLHESGVADTVDPLAGSYFIENLTDSLVSRATAIITEIDRNGGSVSAIEAGIEQAIIENSAYEYQQRVESGDTVIVGVNEYRSEEADTIEIHRLDEQLEHDQCAQLNAYRKLRNTDASREAIHRVRLAAQGTDNIVPVLRDALLASCTLGEICAALRDVWGEHDHR